MKYIDSYEDEFMKFNSLLHNNLTFLESLTEKDFELYKGVKDNFEALLSDYKSFLSENNIPFEMVPYDLKKYVITNKNKRY